MNIFGLKKWTNKKLAKEVESIVFALQTNQAQRALNQYEKVDKKVLAQQDLIEMWRKFSALRFVALRRLGKPADAVEALKQFCQKYGSDDIQMDALVKWLENLDEHSLLVLIDSPIRTVISQQCHFAHVLNDTKRYLELTEKFQTGAAAEVESQIKVDFKDASEPVWIGRENIVQCAIDSSLPNGNIYINLEFTLSNGELKASLPGPSNDGIAECGSIQISQNGDVKDIPIERHQVCDYAKISPYGLQVSDDNIELTLYNLHILTGK